MYRKFIDLNEKYPFSFDTAGLLEEVRKIESGEIDAKWLVHYDPLLSRGWKAIPLVSRGGRMNDPEDQRGAYDYSDFARTPIVEFLPKFRRILDFFKCPQGRIRILKLEPGAGIGEHRDIHHEVASLAHRQVRLHIPIVTNPGVFFYVDGQRYHMKEGGLYYVDFTKRHSVINQGSAARLHLVLDLKVNDWLLRMFPRQTFLDRARDAVVRNVDPIWWGAVGMKQSATQTFWKYYEGSRAQQLRHKLIPKRS